MFSSEYFTVAGYQTDGETLCRACGDKAGLPVSEQFTEAQAYSDYCLDGEGLYCDQCSAEIVAPPEPEENEEANVEECPRCGASCNGDVTIADHGCCIDCHKADLMPEEIEGDETEEG